MRSISIDNTNQFVGYCHTLNRCWPVSAIKLELLASWRSKTLEAVVTKSSISVFMSNALRETQL